MADVLSAPLDSAGSQHTVIDIKQAFITQSLSSKNHQVSSQDPTTHSSTALLTPQTLSCDEHASGDSASTEERTVFAAKQNDDVQFFVGEDRQLMVGKAEELKLVSPVFAAMLNGTWKDRKEGVEIPDVTPQAFHVILRCALRDDSLHLTESIVWDVLKAADKYHVLGLVNKCFHFLLHQHKNRHSSRHICTVVETAHQLGYSQHHTQSMKILKTRAAKVFRSESGLGELCQDCMQALITSKRLPKVPETLVYQAVVTWARCACRKRGVLDPDWQEMRASAENLVLHVRYLTMPRSDLLLLLGVPHVSHASLLSRMTARFSFFSDTMIPRLSRHKPGPQPCLLTEDEVNDLLYSGGRRFPDSVKHRRFKPSPGTPSACTRLVVFCCLIFLVVVGFIFSLSILASFQIPSSNSTSNATDGCMMNCG